MSVRNRDELTAAEVRRLFQDALETERARAVEEFQFGTGSEHKKIIANRIFAWAADQALQSLNDPSTLDRSQELSAHGEVNDYRKFQTIDGYRDMIDFAAKWRSGVEDSNLAALHRLPAPVSANILQQATAHRLRGRLIARQREDFFYHPSVQRRDDHLGA